jgi:potassium channel subfamily K, other eukaryote
MTKLMMACCGSVPFRAVAVATARDTILESFEAAYKKRRRELQRRNRERKRSRAMERARTLAIESRLAAMGVPIYASNNTAAAGGRGGQGVAASYSKHLNVEALTAEQLKAAEEEALAEWNGSTNSRAGGTDADPRSRALEDVRALQDDLATQSVTSDEGYREFTERIAREERNEKHFKVSRY